MELKVIKSLGSGGFGIVELVESASGEHLARKTFSVNQPMPDELVPNVRKRFVREAQLQSGIKHRNIVPILHMELDGESPWYLMPVAENTLHDEIAKDRTLNGNYKVAISDIISGLEELHHMQMTHRDLKPQNVLRFTDAEDGTDYYAISDFGFVSLKDSRLSQLTYTGMKKGADYYTAPEIAKDLRTATVQTDIFSVGCILHDMLGTEDRVPCTEIREESPFGALLLNCTRGKPDRRFKSVSDVRDIFLSIDVDAPPVANKSAEAIVEKLDNDDDLTDTELRNLAEFLEDHADSSDAAALLRRLTLSAIKDFWATEPQATKRIGLQFADWIAQRTAFDFDFCDVLVNRAQAFWDNADFDLKAELAISILILGTSHNRWYVERRFLTLLDSALDDALAKRIAVEFRARGIAICTDIDHLELSISASREQLHPMIVSALGEICK